MFTARSSLLALTLALSFAHPAGARAATADTKLLQQANDLVTKASRGTAHVERVFPGPGGMTGIVINIKGRRTVGWMTGDGKYFLMGNMYGPGDENQTRLAMERLGLVKKPMAPAAFAKASEKATGFTVGTQGPVVTAFIDPNCIFCHRFYQNAKPFVDKGKVRVRFIPVGFLKKSSLGKAAAILAAHDPAKALQENEDGFDDSHEEGAIKPIKTIPANIRKQIEDNMRLLGKRGDLATPTLVYCNKQGEPKVVAGMPRQGMKGLLKKISAKCKF